ncbi:MAG: hypothetical protein CML02_06655 [Pseudooceanicola sp.]|nr:hypothetical protein [Pseudooceanicola sp.]|tara:strand:+ start:1138 stop:1488 length:351 start_codon:yes stop_codon:yes gene_type:complete
MEIDKLYMVLKDQLAKCAAIDDQSIKLKCLRTIEVAMDEYKAAQTSADIVCLLQLFRKDNISASRLFEPDDPTSEGIEILYGERDQLKLFFDNVSTIVCDHKFLSQALSTERDADG